MEELDGFLAELVTDQLISATLSGRRAAEGPEKLRIRQIENNGKTFFQISSFQGKQVFHRNGDQEMLRREIREALEGNFLQLQIRGREWDGSVLVSKKGRVTIRKKRAENTSPAEIRPHNRVKNYILEEGIPVPFLIDLGVMTKEGKVIASRYDKFRQVNRFLEYVRDIVQALPSGREIRILDFGCGKSYLTFAVYYYLKEKKGLDVRITGLDLKEEVIRKCNALARKYGYEKLSFQTGDVADFQGLESLDMMLTLHACDTATDYALCRAVQWGAKVILSVPCCQHEINRQIRNELLEPVLKYGILKERMSALLTDAIRAELLRSAGYEVQLLEFIDMEHTPKNILIRGIRTGNRRDSAGVRRLMEAFQLNPTLERLLQESSDTAKAGENI